MSINHKAGSPAVDRPRSRRSPNAIDAHVGERVRMQRTLQGMSQEKLGKALGLTFQQVQKYERGVNRIGASRLFQLSQVFDVPVNYFFEDFEESSAGESYQAGFSETAASHVKDPLSRRETLELVRAYYKVKDPKTRRVIFELVKAVAKSDQNDPDGNYSPVWDDYRAD